MTNHRVQYTADTPRDESLRGLPDLLSPVHLAALLSQKLATAGMIEGLTIDHVRYKPSTSCVASFRAILRKGEDSTSIAGYGKCYTEADFGTALTKATERGYKPRYDLPGLIELAGERILVFLFPNDAGMKGLEILSQPKRLQRLLYEHNDEFPEGEWRVSDSRMTSEVLRYKPEKRAVLRIDTKVVRRSDGERRRLQVYARTYADQRGRDIERLMAELYVLANAVPELAVPRPIVYLEDPHLLLVAHLDGTPLTDLMAQAASEGLIQRTASALARLHSFRSEVLEEWGVGELAQQAYATGRTLCTIIPGLEHTVSEVLSTWVSRMEDMIASAPCLVHGDFYYGQVLIADDCVGILDFDRSYLGDPLADVGNFCAHVRLMEIEGRLVESNGIAERFVRAYEIALGTDVSREAVALYTTFGLFQLTVRPFRSLRSGWRNEVEALIRECVRMSE